jgi:hypothetical protein
MSLDPLATVADLEARLGRTLTGTDADRAMALLTDASATVRNRTGQTFVAETTTARLRVRGTLLRLPQRPVTAVNTITAAGGDTVGFTWHAGDTLTLAAVPAAGWVDVNYDHGYDDVPDDIVGVVCNIAGRAFGTPSDEGGYQSETIGTYSYAMGVAAAAGASGLLNDERAILDRYTRVGGYAWIAS